MKVEEGDDDDGDNGGGVIGMIIYDMSRLQKPRVERKEGEDKRKRVEMVWRQKRLRAQ